MLGGHVSVREPTVRGAAEGDTTSSSRRPDIQGLRAVAVLLVVAFHAGLPLPGGFIGVDVFFVISGFVITSMLQREWSSTGRLMFGRFYLRRFKRLVPALALMITVVMVASALILSPLGPQQNAANTAIGAMLLVANFVIVRTTGGYFDAPAETNPLLNTWSLSVEEQFYLVFPALIALGWCLARRSSALRMSAYFVVGAIAVVSFALAVVGSLGLNLRGSGSILGFYSPFTRAWEFAAGALLALALSRRALKSTPLLAGAGILGLLLLTVGLWAITDTTPFPGPWTLVPVAAAMLLILAGTSPKSPTSRLLSTRPMVKIGDWSYSIYLWHWPLIVFAVVIWPFNFWAPIIAAVVAWIPAVASYRWVEQPIRGLAVSGAGHITILVTIVVIPPLLIAGAVSTVASRYWIPRYASNDVLVVNDGDTEWASFHRYLNENFYPCQNAKIREYAPEYEGITRCRQSQAGPDVDVALVGDSHAEHLFLGLAEALPDVNVAFYILGALPVEDGAGMSRIIHEVADDPSIETVIVSANWAIQGVPELALTDTLRSFASAGKQVFVTDDVPFYPFPATSCKYQQGLLISRTQCSQPADRFLTRYSQYMPRLQSAVNSVPGAHLLPTALYFCNADLCEMSRDGQLLYRDDNHLNDTGSRFIADRLLADNPALRTAIFEHDGSGT